MDFKESQKKLQIFLEKMEDLILGKSQEIKLLLCCFLSKGHMLIEDIPGTGKTTLAEGFASLLGLDFQRIQCTNDLLPGDILGANVYDKKNNRFVFHPGPIFTNILLIDELNRASPKTQSGLMEAMAENQVTIDRETFYLPNPFFVIATQNPLEEIGTYPLPTSQLDRFFMRMELGYPTRKDEIILLQGEDRYYLLKKYNPLLNYEEILSLQQMIENIFVSSSIYSYIMDLIIFTRDSGLFETGLSPRAGIYLTKASKTWAFIMGRDFVIPEDVQNVFPTIAFHRLDPVEDKHKKKEKVESVLKLVTIP